MIAIIIVSVWAIAVTCVLAFMRGATFCSAEVGDQGYQDIAEDM